jgi:hypothetical protein
MTEDQYNEIKSLLLSIDTRLRMIDSDMVEIRESIDVLHAGQGQVGKMLMDKLNHMEGTIEEADGEKKKRWNVERM